MIVVLTLVHIGINKGSLAPPLESLIYLDPGGMWAWVSLKSSPGDSNMEPGFRTTAVWYPWRRVVNHGIPNPVWILEIHIWKPVFSLGPEVVLYCDWSNEVIIVWLTSLAGAHGLSPGVRSGSEEPEYLQGRQEQARRERFCEWQFDVFSYLSFAEGIDSIVGILSQWQ